MSSVDGYIPLPPPPTNNNNNKSNRCYSSSDFNFAAAGDWDVQITQKILK
jgi:hypothetical protein